MQIGRGVTVIGSANMDVVLSVDRIPGPGETVLARSTTTHPGGKGLNQAIAALRAGATTAFIACVGWDENGEKLIASMVESGLDNSLVATVAGPTGQAIVIVDDEAENSIVVSGGANSQFIALTTGHKEVIANSSVLLLQLEVAVELVASAANEARQQDIVVMLNAAPAQALPTNLLRLVDYLLVNEHEARILGKSDDLVEASLALAAQIDHVVVTLGASGAELFEGGKSIGVTPSPPVTAIDTTGAGDTFCGAFAAAIAEGMSFLTAAEFAAAAASLSVTIAGTLPSIPIRSAIQGIVARDTSGFEPK